MTSATNSRPTLHRSIGRHALRPATALQPYNWYHWLITPVLMMLSSQVFATLETLDRVAAIVDDDVVMVSELDERVQQLTMSFKTKGRPMPPPGEMRTGVLDQLIVENLQLQLANRAGMRISDAQLNESMERLATSNGMNLEQFRQTLAKEGMSYTAAREQVRRDITIQQVQQSILRGQINITDQDVDNFLKSDGGQELIDTRYQIAHILVPLEAMSNSSDESRQRALLLRAASEIRAGTPLEKWLSAYNRSASTPLQGGDLGWRSSNELPDIFADVVTPMTVGEVAGPLRSGGGLHLVQLTNRRGGAQVVTQTHARHILLKPSEIRNEQQCEALLKQLRKRILSGEPFADVAQQYTEDMASAQEGGDLGWATKGQFVPAFEETMANTPVDTISQPFRSKFGWHILQVLGYRQHDMSQQAAREQAYRYLFQRKFQGELEAWLQKIRDEAYVDIKV